MSNAPDAKTKQRLRRALSSLKRTGAALQKLKPPKPDPVAAMATLRQRHNVQEVMEA